MQIPLDKDEIVNLALEVDRQIGLLQRRKRGMALFEDDVEQKAEYKRFGKFGKYGTMNALRNKLDALRSKIWSGDELSDEEKKQYLKDREQCINFVDAAKYHLSAIGNDPFVGKTWYVYFLYIPEHEEPKIGRTVLQIPKKEEVDFKNIKDGLSPDYIGSYKYLHNKVLFFDLDNINRDRKLHMKVACKNVDAEVLIGAYITFEFDHIVTGTVVFQAINSSNEVAAARPMIFPYANKEKSSPVPWPIQKFLSIRNLNYYKAPKDKTTIEALNGLVESYSLSENMKSRFLELDHPIAYIATPEDSLPAAELSLKDEVITGVIKDLEKLFPKVDFVYSPNEPLAIDSNKSITQVYLELLKQTRFFILINTELDIASFSFVQFGWALAHCKNIIVIYKQGSISSRILSLDKLGVLFYPFTDIQKDARKIKAYIEESIKSALPKDLTGS